ncbi:unnamed protein product [Bathycoccus prasinos]
MFSLATTSSSTTTRIASSSSSSLKNNTKYTKRQPQQRCVMVAGNNDNDNNNHHHHHQQQHRGNKAALLAATMMLISSSPIIHPETAFAEVTCNLVTPCTMPPPNGEPRYIMPSSQYDPAKDAEEKFMKQLEAKRNKTAATANAAVVEEEPKAVAPEAASE